MKANELRQLSQEELLAELASQREALFNLRMRQAGGEASVGSEFGKLRRDIARILTVLREQESASVSGSGAETDND